MMLKEKMDPSARLDGDIGDGVRSYDDSRGSDSRVAIYVRLARVFREKIIGGAWMSGQRLPTVQALAEQYQVAAVTIRQAYALLTSEGLISSSRGRGTFVEKNSRLAVDDPDLRRAINDPFELAPGQTIDVVAKRRVKGLPPEFGQASERGEYVQVRKVHSHHGRAFVLLDIFVLHEVFRQFPRGSEKRSKIMALLRDYSGRNRIVKSRQEVTISHADTTISRYLRYPMGASLVRLRSWRWDAEDTIIYAGVNHYRGDSFVLDYTQSLDERGGPRPWLTPLPTS